jgi:hypothetical protein
MGGGYVLDNPATILSHTTASQKVTLIAAIVT